MNKKAKSGPMTTYEKLSLVITSMGVIAAIVVLIVYALQLKEMQKATEAANQSAKAAQQAAEAAMAGQRAYVAAKPYWTPDARFGVIFRNVGNLPTRNLRNYINFVITKGDLPVGFTCPINAKPIAMGTLLVPHDEVWGPHVPRDGNGISQADLAAISKGEKNLYFFGWAKYFDGFPGTPERITEFCYSLRVTGNGEQPFVFTPYSKYNCADEGCAEKS